MTDYMQAAIEAGAKAMADDWNPGRDPILTAMFRDYSATAIQAALPHIRAMIAQEIETAQFKVESTHHFHGTKCLCGFNSNGRARSATEHITQTLNAAQIVKGQTK